jgi:hypothetical protein
LIESFAALVTSGDSRGGKAAAGGRAAKRYNRSLITHHLFPPISCKRPALAVPSDRIGAAAGPSIPGGWIVAGVADFNRNGHLDYVLFNSMARATVIWYMNNNVRGGSAVGPTLPSGWTLVAP